MLKRLEKYYQYFNLKILIFLILVIAIVTFSSYNLFMHYMNTDDIVLKEDLTCEFREVIYASEFIESLDGELIDNYLVDTSEVGFKKIEVKYRNNYGITVKFKITIEVLDVTAPTIVVSNPYTIESGSITSLSDSIFCADDYDDNINCVITGDYDLNTPGSYDLKIEATDNSNNVTSKEFTLKVVSPVPTDNNSSNTNADKSYTSFSEIYSKYKTSNTMVGLDLSRWQGEVDFAKLKEAGTEFVMLKIGGQKERGGEISVDPMFYTNLEEAKANDIKVGVYFYSFATSVSEAEKQAKWIINTLDGAELDLPIAFDWENWSTFTTFHISFNTLNKIATAFIEKVENSNYQGMLYSSKYYLENIWYYEDYLLWVAYYTDNYDSNLDYFIWQLASDGIVDGIDGYVDIDVMKLN